ncbi:MAG TPA: hypothetical protein VIS48_02405 [Candidatus Kryptonia bacterium]
MILILLIQAKDTLALRIPSFSDRLNFLLPLIVILLIVMFFLLLKSFAAKEQSKTNTARSRGKSPI